MEAREPLTIRFPVELLAQAREMKADGESLNDLVVNAVEREVRRRQGWQAYEEGVRLHDEILARRGPLPDSTELIRSLREGHGRHDD